MLTKLQMPKSVTINCKKLFKCLNNGYEAASVVANSGLAWAYAYLILCIEPK